MAIKNIDFHVELSSDTYSQLYNLFNAIPARKRAERARMLLEKGRLFEGMEGSINLGSLSKPAERVESPSISNVSKSGVGKLDKSLGKNLLDLFPD